MVIQLPQAVIRGMSGTGYLLGNIYSNAHGAIDNGAELFGNHTQLKNGQSAANGFSTMTDVDANSDGIIDTGELKMLADLGIQSIGAGYTSTPITDTHDNLHREQGSYTRADGSAALAEDVWFKVDLPSTRNENLLPLSEAIRNLPEIQGKGNVASLRQVMAQQEANGDSTLKNLIEQSAAEDDPVARNALTGDARKVYAMEAMVGEGYRRWRSCSATINGGKAANDEAAHAWRDAA